MPNIFVSDENPVQAAQNLDDKRIIHMTLQLGQLLCTVAHHAGVNGPLPYLPAPSKTQLVKWVLRSHGNFMWLWMHFLAVCDEYQYRFKRIHETEQLIKSSQLLFETSMRMPRGPRIGWPSSCGGNITECRKLLKHKWAVGKRFPKWTHRKPPIWWFRPLNSPQVKCHDS